MENAGERLKNLIAQMTIKSGNENVSYNYFGYIFSRIARISDNNIPSIMGVGPRKDGTLALYFNSDYFPGTSDEVIRKVIEHEGMHVLNKHVPRLLRVIANEPNEKMKFAKSRIWNTASDCAANPPINMPREMIIAGQPFQGCFPDLYDMEDDQMTETYYYELLDQAKKNQKKQQQQCNKCDGKGSNSDCQFSGKDDKGNNECKMPSSGDGMPINTGSHSGEGELYDVIGDHSKWDEVTKEVTDVNSLSRKIDGHIQEIIKDSVKNFKNRRGTLPGHIQSLIDAALAPPQVPYYQIIRKLIKGSRYSKFKRSLSRINRKRTYSFAISGDGSPEISPFPGKTRDFTFKIVILIDTSGSMDIDAIREALSGCKNIIEKDRHCDVTVLEVDTQIQKEYKVKRISDIDFEIKGRGGTTLHDGLERARQINPDVMLGFTDGGTENINEYSKKFLPRRIIWVVQKDEKGGQINTLDKTGFIVRVD